MDDATTRPPGRAAGRVLTALGGTAGAAAGLAVLATVVSTALDGSGTSSPTIGLLVALGLFAAALGLATVAARMLGVRSVLARAGYAVLVAASGFVVLWVIAIVVGRLAS